MAGCQFSPEVSLREKIAVDYTTVVTSQPTHPLDLMLEFPARIQDVLFKKQTT